MKHQLGAQYVHGEAFCLMTYLCTGCGLSEKLWNSRDGVTPFMIHCDRCGGSMQHVNWHGDRRLPGYVPRPGERYFRNGTPAEARACLERRIPHPGEGEWSPATEEERQAIIAEALAEAHGEFQPGWPWLAKVPTLEEQLATARRRVEELHLLVSDCNAAVDPERWPALAQRISRELSRCDEAGRCLAQEEPQG